MPETDSSRKKTYEWQIEEAVAAAKLAGFEIIRSDETTFAD